MAILEWFISLDILGTFFFDIHLISVQSSNMGCLRCQVMVDPEINAIEVEVCEEVLRTLYVIMFINEYIVCCMQILISSIYFIYLLVHITIYLFC